MSKFKVGDKVRILDGSRINDYFGGWIDSMNKYIGRVYTIESVPKKSRGTGYCGYRMKEIGYVWDERGLGRTEDKLKNQKIVITYDGKTTTAKLFDGKQVIKTATARCCPSDEFDFNIGASIALERLTGQILGKTDNALFDWNGFKDGKFDVVVTRDSIDRFLEECDAHEIAHADDMRATDFNPIKDIDTLSPFAKVMLRKIFDVDLFNECSFEVEGGKLLYSFNFEIKESTVRYD